MTKRKPVRAPAVPMTQRNLRVDVEVWDEAARHAAAEDPPRGISDVVRAELAAYNARQRKADVQ